MQQVIVDYSNYLILIILIGMCCSIYMIANPYKCIVPEYMYIVCLLLGFVAIIAIIYLITTHNK